MKISKKITAFVSPLLQQPQLVLPRRRPDGVRLDHAEAARAGVIIKNQIPGALKRKI